MRFSAFFLYLLLALPTTTQADDSCMDLLPIVEHTGVQSMDFSLPTRTIYGLFQTRAAAHVRGEESSVRVHFDHILPPGQVGLAYNVYRLELLVGAEQDPTHFLYEQDFTEDCQGPGISFFPGETYEMRAIKLPPRSDGKDWAQEPLRVRIWGHL